MVLPFVSSLNYWQRGFLSVLLFYAVGLGGTVVLAQFMPVADMCNPGVPFLTAILTLVIGAVGAFNALIALLLGYRADFIKGFLAADFLVLAGIVIAILKITYSA